MYDQLMLFEQLIKFRITKKKIRVEHSRASIYSYIIIYFYVHKKNIKKVFFFKLNLYLYHLIGIPTYLIRLFQAKNNVWNGIWPNSEKK